LDLVGNGFVAIGWDEIRDLTNLGFDKDALKEWIAAGGFWGQARSDPGLGGGAAALSV
jgi:hypothetical protein